MTSALHFLKKVSLVFAGLALSFSAHAEDYIVKIKQNFTTENLSTTISQINGIKVLDQHEVGRLILIQTDSPVNEVEKRLNTIDGFEYLVPNIKFHIIATNDPHYGKQWNLAKIGAEKAWEKENNTKHPIVAVIDTGIDYKHEDLATQMYRNDKGEIIGWNFIENNNDPMDIISTQPRGNPGHGTHCAGIIAASRDNGIGVSGIAPKALLMPLRFIGPDGSGDLMNSIKAIDFAIQNNAQIISASWGAAVSRSVVKPLIEAIERAGQKGIIFVAAAANDGKSNDTREVYPANAGLPNVISVAASDKNDSKPTWSNYGRAKVDLASPGVGILSTLPNNKYGELSGTSMATPLVAGMLALLLGQSVADGHSFNAPEFKAIMQANSAKVQIETACNCRISAEQSMNAIVANDLTVVPNAGTFAPGEGSSFHAIGGKGPYTFTSSNPSVASITPEGQLKALADGNTIIKATDSLGKIASSGEIFVGKNNTPAPGGECPIGNPELCELICKLMPNAPWCKQLDLSKLFSKL